MKQLFQRSSLLLSFRRRFGSGLLLGTHVHPGTGPNASSTKELFGTFSSHKHIVNHIHLSACWNSLGHLTRAADQHWFQVSNARFRSAVGQHKDTLVFHAPLATHFPFEDSSG